MPLTLQVASATDTGRVREANEDNVWAGTQSFSDQQPVALLVVCDGVGGSAGGELASEWAVQAIRRELQDLFGPPKGAATVRLSPEEMPGALDEARGGAAARKLDGDGWDKRLSAAVKQANRVVRELAEKRPEEAAGAGSTAVVALVHGEDAVLANVGDSRGYLLRGGGLTQITRDHSVVASLVAGGMLRPDDIYSHPQRNVIYRSLGGGAEVVVDLFPLTVQGGDRLLLCSDGLWEMVRDPQIAGLLAAAGTPAEACAALIAAANDSGGEDNISAAVLFVT